jgi:hypothetical protein
MKKAGIFCLALVLCLVFTGTVYAEGRGGGALDINLPAAHWYLGMKMGKIGIYAKAAYLGMTINNPVLYVGSTSIPLTFNFKINYLSVGPILTYDVIQRPYGNLFFGVGANFMMPNGSYTGSPTVTFKGSMLDINPFLGVEMFFKELPEFVFFTQIGFGFLIVDNFQATMSSTTYKIEPKTSYYRTPTVRIGFLWRMGRIATYD